MPLPQPIPNILLEFVRKFDEFGSLFGAGASGEVVFDGIAFDAIAASSSSLPIIQSFWLFVTLQI